MSQKAIVTVIKSRRTTKSGMIRTGTITIIKRRDIESGMARKGIVAAKSCRIKGKGGTHRKGIASIIRSLRIENGMTHKDLAEKVGISKKFTREITYSQSI